MIADFRKDRDINRAISEIESQNYVVCRRKTGAVEFFEVSQGSRDVNPSLIAYLVS